MLLHQIEGWRINGVEFEDVRQKLRFAFTAILPRASRRYQWSAQRPLNAQNQTYYIAPVYYEWNVFDLFARKVRAISRADEELSARRAAIGAHGVLRAIGLWAPSIKTRSASAPARAVRLIQNQIHHPVK